MTPHDRVVHHPFGAGLYYFKENLVKYLSKQCPKHAIVLHMGSQPNCSPHIGNITTFATGFALAAALRANLCREVRIQFIYVDSAPTPGQDITINGIRYQRSLKQTGDFWTNQSLFAKVLDQLSNLSKVPYDIETQNFWLSKPVFPTVLRDIVAQNKTLGSHVSPETGKLDIRASCPREGCGLADKHGVNNSIP
jgi:hypothetical protein